MLAGRRSSNSGCYFEKLLFAVNKGVDVVRRKLEAMAVGDSIRRASFHAITAKNTSRIINIVNAGIALAGRDPVHIGIFGGFDIYAIRGTGGGAKKAPNTLFQSAFITVQDVNPPVTRLEMDGLVRIVFRDRLTKHISEGNAEALHQRAKRLAHFADDRCHKLRV